MGSNLDIYNYMVVYIVVIEVMKNTFCTFQQFHKLDLHNELAETLCTTILMFIRVHDISPPH